MRRVMPAVVALLAVLIEASFLASWRPLGVVPNLFLIALIYVGLTRTPAETLGVAIGGGLYLDIVASGTDFGLRTAFYTFIALGLLVLKQAGADFENRGMVMGAAAAGTVVFDGILIGELWRNGVSISWGLVLGRVGIELAFNLALALVIGPVLARMLKRPSNLPVIGQRA